MASKYGVTPEGFVRPRLPEIKAELESQLSEALGVTINTRADSVFGQLIGVLAEREAIFWETAEQTYYAMYPHTADGVQMDNSVAFSGVRRVSAEKTTLIATCYGKNNTTLPFGSRIKSNSDGKMSFTSTEVGYISVSKTAYADIAIATITTGATYTITVDGTTYSYTAQAGDTVSMVLLSIAALMADLEATVSVNNNTLTIDRIDHRTGFTLSISSNMNVSRVGTPIAFACDNYGALTPAIGTVTQIVSQVAGWESVANKVAATTGRDTEADTTLRTRYGRSVYRQGLALVEAIQARLYEDVTGVTAAIVFENTSDTIDSDGRPPHSIEAVVQGGDDAEIAQMLWQTKAPGIDTYGNIAVVIADSQGVSHTMNFNRPTLKKVWLKVVIGKNLDESFPGNTPQQVQSLVFGDGQAHKVGQDVILQRFLKSIFTNTIGIGFVTITAAVSDATPTAGEYTADNIVISDRELASFAAERIEVTAI